MSGFEPATILSAMMRLLPIYIDGKLISMLLNYYDDGSKKTEKTIKIKDQEEFTRLCTTLSRQIREEIKDTFVTMYGSEEGIEKVNIMEYGVDHSVL